MEKSVQSLQKYTFHALNQDKRLDQQPPQEALTYTFEEFRMCTLGEIARKWNPKIKTFIEVLVEKKIRHLKKLADQQYLQVSEEKCNEIILELENSQEIQTGKTTALHLAAAGKNYPFRNKKLAIGEAMAIIKKLLGVDANLKTGEKIIFSSSSQKIQDIINCQDAEGRTALHLAAKSAGGIIYWLMILKADPTIKDNHGKTALDYIPWNWVHVKKSVKNYLKYW